MLQDRIAWSQGTLVLHSHHTRRLLHPSALPLAGHTGSWFLISPTIFGIVGLSNLCHRDAYKRESHSVVSNSLQPQGLYSPWNSPGQNAGVGSLSLLRGIFPTQESNPGLPHCRQILYQHLLILFMYLLLVSLSNSSQFNHLGSLPMNSLLAFFLVFLLGLHVLFYW